MAPLRLFKPYTSSNSLLLSKYSPIYRVLFNSSVSTQIHEVPNKKVSPALIKCMTILDQWRNKGNEISDMNVDELKNMIKVFRNHNEYSQAIQLSELITDKTPGNIAVHLDLTARVYGLQQAEYYFDSIPDSLKNYKVYGTLLNCYAFNLSLEKAESTMEKMKQLGYMTSHSYHSMLSLYTKTRNHKRLVKLVDEMLKTGVRYHRTTYYMHLTAYGTFDIEAMEKLLGYMETNPDITLDWRVYLIAAKGYLNFDQKIKSLEMLKKSEAFVYQNTDGIAYESLITMYANLGEKEDVYRIWDLYKKTWRKVSNTGYHHMVSALVKLDDLEGAEKILTEWESSTNNFDFWVVNVLVNGYSKKGYWKKAESYVERLVGMGMKPPTSTWNCLATAFCNSKEMEKAVIAMKNAILSYDNRWKLNQVTLKSCIKYLQEKGDTEVANEFAAAIEGHNEKKPKIEGAMRHVTVTSDQ
ncbi:pentatricopeptide repeat-containing protein At2g20710, mitochondrial-like [Rutidosis leptorrhynchoides]|uniref:pentatricopeptide repeat-containing protein At2g20710, mitochondrial-like n=1 Tax=Rutidosis leptorrhynchoides TaxID=125765 RepID=UPI003A99C934